MSEPDVGGEPPCWAHLFDGDLDETPTNPECAGLSAGPVVDLGAVPVGSGGAIWSLPHGGDLDANLIRLDPVAGIGAHVNNDVDVLVFVQSGTGELTVDGRTEALGADHLALIPKGSLRSIAAGAAGLTYLSVHRRRSPLGITNRSDDEGEPR